MTPYAEAALWAALCLGGGRIECYDPIHNEFYTVEAYKRERHWEFGDDEYGIDIRTWGKNKPYEQHCVRYRLDPLSPLKGYRRNEEKYDASGNLLDDYFHQ